MALKKLYPIINDDEQQYFRHVKRGTVYSLHGIGSFQTKSSNPLDGEICVIYISKPDDEGDTKTYIRPIIDFMDGRFVKIIKQEYENGH